jgi:F420-non-reducing hydrogenase small subunit
MGPVSRVRDQGAKMLSALAAGIRASEPDRIDEAIDDLVDPVGTLYRYGLARSLLRGRAGRREE